MARYKLSGLRRLDELSWHDVEYECGVYLFCETRIGPCRYVGRSDTSLRSRIRGRQYRYYQYKHCDDELEAYEWECEYFHRYEDTIDNKYHPARPSGYRDLECPVCGC